jgi:hypothetical protein
MGAPFYTWTGKDCEFPSDSDDILCAWLRYGFDHPTAQRLAFVRWLWRCGGLDDG